MSHVKRHHFRLCQTDRLEKYLSGGKADLNQITLVIRVGPLHLGSCSCNPWRLQIRPLAIALGLESSLQSFRPLLATTAPL
jgi:hypothetical protein